MASAEANENPFLFREIHKTAYLRWLPPEFVNGKYKQLVNKKHNITPTWTVLCVHNGVAPYLEQYPSPTSAECLAHRPLMRVSLRTTRHITASIRPWPGDQYDFLLVTQNGAARMLAPDWNSMQDWVSTLRVKLRELKILEKGENVYGAPPQAPLPRAPARDPHSPLPPAPATPADRIPGIEIPTRVLQTPDATEAVPEEPNSNDSTRSNEYAAVPELMTPQPTEAVAPNFNSQTYIFSEATEHSVEDAAPSTSREYVSTENLTALLTSLPLSDCPAKDRSVKNIAGQNICFDDSILRRDAPVSDEDLFQEFDKIATRYEIEPCAASVTVQNCQNVQVEGCTADVEPMRVVVEDGLTRRDGYTKVDLTKKFKNRLMVNGSDSNLLPSTSTSIPVSDRNGYHPNVTVIEVSNARETPHSAAPLTTPGRSVFEFPPQTSTKKLIRVESDSANLTTVKLTGDAYETVAEAATSSRPSPRPRRKFLESLSRPARKTSLPDVNSVKAALINRSNDSTYGYLYPVHSGSEESNRGSEESNRGRGEEERSERKPKSGGGFLARKFSTSPRRDGGDNKCDSSKTTLNKGLFMRGLTEVNFLTRLRDGFGSAKFKGEVTQQNGGGEQNGGRQCVASNGTAVTHRSRRDNSRGDADFGARRRSSSLSADTQGQVVTLRTQQVSQLRAEQARSANILMRISRIDLKADRPIFADAFNQVWICNWGRGGWVCGGRAGDRVLKVRGSVPRSAAHATELLGMHSHAADIEFNRIPQGKVYLVTRCNANEPLGIRLDASCRLAGAGEGAAARAGLPVHGRWTLTEVNNRPIALVNGYESAMTLLGARGTEVSIVLQPTPFVEKLKNALNKARH